MNDLTDTICALSTAPGRSGLAVVRVSGPESMLLFYRLFLPKHSGSAPPPRVAVLGRIVDPRNGLEIDEAIATCFPSPRSYTGEDMTEYSIHGSPVLIAELLDSLCACGAKLASPGEFTMRAFLHGRMDLTQAEAVRDLIEATTLFQAQVAARQRSGELARRLQSAKQQLIDIIVNLESAVEFVEEDLSLDSREQAAVKLEQVQRELRSWIDSFRQGRIIRDGFSMAVVGRPNVGKSSVFNALLAQDRSIVTETPGTTRDLISELTSMGGIPVRVLDTAGIHDSDDHIEKLGISRSLQAIADADAILLVVDISRPQAQQDWILRRQLGPLSCIAVMNKSDLSPNWSPAERNEFSGDWPCVEVSAKTGSGIDALRSLILTHILGDAKMSHDGIVVTNLRHCHSMEAAEKGIARAAATLREGLSEEFVLADLQGSLRELGAITGETHVEDLLEEIFSRFCVGK
jgi:tRNA modification GTPase